jgi:hypothetical protein
VLICPEKERGVAEELVKSHLKPVSSCLAAMEKYANDDGSGVGSAMKRAILEVKQSVIATYIVS